ncbi:hypothetical protein [Rhodospirillum sp. A1_3_36]|uniref:hypothetical protein n=1 Tax=Rhodospirillum sp. A1_3_36 TaxID=3391666 RepID=UPI0039A726C1
MSLIDRTLEAAKWPPHCLRHTNGEKPDRALALRQATVLYWGTDNRFSATCHRSALTMPTLSP